VTDTSIGDPDAPVEEPTAEPARRQHPKPPPSSWARRGAIAAVLLVAFAIVAVGTRSTVSGDSNGKAQIVQLRTPTAGAVVLRQSEVGADLLEGYDGRLVINGTAIPEEQMDGVVDPATSPEATVPGGGPTALRPNNRRHVFFTPGPGKVFRKLPPGKVEITVNYFRDGQPSVGRGSETWVIDAQ
jgi:hypothetical protein